jgi:hypothetical protein
MRGLELAEALDDRLNQLRLIGRLHIFPERAGEFHKALVFAQRGEAVAAEIGDPVGVAAAHSMLGISRHLMGDQAAAQMHLEAVLAQPAASQRIGPMYFGYHRNRARIALARTLWLRGCPDQAVRVARETVDEAAGIGHPVTLCIAGPSRSITGSETWRARRKASSALSRTPTGTRWHRITRSAWA